MPLAGEDHLGNRILIEKLDSSVVWVRRSPSNARILIPLPDQRGGFVIGVAAQVAAENLSGLPGQRAVYINGKVRHRSDHFFLF